MLIGTSLLPRSKPQTPEVRFDGRVQLGGLGLLLSPLGGEARHLLLEWLAVVLLGFRADVATRGEDVAVLADLFERGALAEAGNVGVDASVLLAPPGMIRIGDAGDAVVRSAPGACGPPSGPSSGRRRTAPRLAGRGVSRPCGPRARNQRQAGIWVE